MYARHPVRALAGQYETQRACPAVSAFTCHEQPFANDALSGLWQTGLLPLLVLLVPHGAQYRLEGILQMSKHRWNGVRPQIVPTFRSTTTHLALGTSEATLFSDHCAL